MRLPGLVDAHVHLRTPGGEHKEDFRTGSMAALAGGFTTLLAMPNTNPPLVTAENWSIAQQLAKSHSLCDVFLYAGGSAEHIAELPALSHSAIALKLYLDQTYGPLRVQGLETLQKIMELWPASKPICLHAEQESIAVGVALAALYRKPIHFCHVSRKDEIELIAKAKAEGLPVTCEVTPHHLFLTEADALRLGPYADMRPRLASQVDVDALWQHLGSTIDCIASDHAPHAHWEKQGYNTEAEWRQNPGRIGPNPIPPGIPGLESTLPLMLTALSQKRLSLERLIQLLHTNPTRIFHLPAQPDTWVEVDLPQSYTFPDHPLYTKCGWSPFEGMHMTGAIRQVVLRGKEVVSNGKVIDPPNS